MLWVTSLEHPIDVPDPRQPDLNRDTTTPLLVITGCRPWPLSPTPVCEGCGGSVKRYKGKAICLVCHGVSHLTAGMIAALSRRQVRNATAGETGDSERRAKDELKRDSKRRRTSILTEHERRHLWLGVEYRRAKDFNVRVTAARTWLREIGQEPDWSLVIDKRGNVLARRDEPEPAEA